MLLDYRPIITQMWQHVCVRCESTCVFNSTKPRWLTPNRDWEMRRWQRKWDVNSRLKRATVICRVIRVEEEGSGGKQRGRNNKFQDANSMTQGRMWAQRVPGSGKSRRLDGWARQTSPFPSLTFPRGSLLTGFSPVSCTSETLTFPRAHWSHTWFKQTPGSPCVGNKQQIWNLKKNVGHDQTMTTFVIMDVRKIPIINNTIILKG